MDYSLQVVKSIGYKLNIDIAKYQRCPTKEETLKLFNYIINKITITDVNTKHSVMDICRIVNYVLARLKSSVKVYYNEFMKPNQTTFMAICVLALHISKVAADTELEAVINEKEIKLCELKAAEQKNVQLGDSIKETDDNLIQLSVDLTRENELVIKEKRLLVEEQAKYKEKAAKLKDIQNKTDLLNVQINEAGNKDDKLKALLEEEHEVAKQLITYEDKKWHLQKLNDEISKEEAKLLQYTEEVTTTLDPQLIDTLQKLNEDLAQLCYMKTDSDSLSEENFNLQRKLCSLQKQIQVVAFTEEEQHTATDKLECLIRERKNSQITLDKLNTKYGKLYQDLSMIQEQCLQMEAMFKDNCILLHIHSEKYYDSIQTNRNNFGI